MNLIFLGAAHEVTGSCTLLTACGKNILIDCGMEQGLSLIHISFAVIVAKLPFGNARSHMFTPAAAGIAFVTICMPDKVFSYPALLSSGTTDV